MWYVSLFWFLDYVIYLHDNKCPYFPTICSSAVYLNKLECLIYLHEKGYKWDEETLETAVEEDSFECLIYLHENLVSYNKNKLLNLASNLKINEYIENYM